MIDPIQLADAGPVAILLVGIGLLALGFVRGFVVPGWLYRQERDARLKSDTQAERARETVEANTAALKELADIVRALEGQRGDRRG